MTVFVSANSAKLFGERFALPDSLVNFVGVISSVVGIFESFLENPSHPST
jgi:hypothetical protein